VVRTDRVDFIYDIRICEYLMPDFAYPRFARIKIKLSTTNRAEVFLRRGGQSYDIFGCERNQIIDDILGQFEKYLHFLHLSPGILPWNMDEHDEMFQNSEEGSA